MMGHLDAISYVTTNREFYEKMPEELKRIQKWTGEQIAFKLSMST